MPIPDTLVAKIDHFSRYGRLVQRDMDLFGAASWLAVHIGQFNWPEAANPLHSYVEAPERSEHYVARLADAIARAAETMPTHAAIL